MPLLFIAQINEHNDLKREEHSQLRKFSFLKASSILEKGCLNDLKTCVYSFMVAILFHL